MTKAGNIVTPVCVSDDPGRLGACYEHPAFATIGASRISGQTNLFASNINHNGFVRIRISHARLYREAHHDRVFGGDRIVEVDMSEAQWVAFVSRMNMGSGTPCTLLYAPTGTVEGRAGIPPQPDPAARLDEVARGIAAQNRANVEKHHAELRALCEGLPAKKRDAILAAAGYMSQHLKANHDFAEKVLVEHKEQLVTEAKTEINAMVNNTLLQLGVSSLQQLAQNGEDAMQLAASLPALPSGNSGQADGGSASG